MSAFQVELGASDLNYVDVPLNPTHSLIIMLLMLSAAYVFNELCD